MWLKVRVCRIALLAAGWSLAACAAAAAPMEAPGMDLTGLWQGELRVIPCFAGTPREIGRCNAVNRISFDLRQRDSTLTGDYRCAIGTMVCRDANTTDRGTVVSGTVSGRDLTMRVMLPGDLSSCLYHGSQYTAGELRGGYRCYQGGGLAEVGVWQVSRAAGRIPPRSSPRE